MGNYLPSPLIEKTSKCGKGANLRYAISEMQGWRKTMEDAIMCEIGLEGLPEAAMFGVFDGHGGSDVATYVNSHIKNIFEKQKEYIEGDYENALIKTFLQIDQDLLSDEAHDFMYSKKKSSFSFLNGRKNLSNSCGCTANIVCIIYNNIYIANTGDSRCVLSRDGIAISLSNDHKPENVIEHTRIVDAGGYIHKGRVNGNLNLSRALGDHTYKKDMSLSQESQIISPLPDINKIIITEKDEFILIACDGIWEMGTTQSLITWLHDKINDEEKNKKNEKNEKNEKNDMIEVVESLMDHCLAPSLLEYCGLGCDNMSCVLIDLREKAKNLQKGPEINDIDMSSTSTDETLNRIYI
eukprot:GHVL01041135.1.p1 GENE.GHVL01041135.1~~GHVL01041135.1.p1  ORF type:complete len:368 (+),score=105.50 GHVL01041135.1:48-1106(+)